MSKPTLLVLAAGMGSRYGGLKQIDPVGPSGETIIDYSIYDAMRAGFGKLVFVIRGDIETPFKEIIGARFADRIQVEYAFQELDKLPVGFKVPDGRTKPWGTTQAILMAEDVITEPFAAINGDDFYGADSFKTLANQLNSGSADYSMVGFTLRNTLSDFGSVARGVCQVSQDGYLKSILELTKIERDGNGGKYTDASSGAQKLTGDEPVSMNMWGFQANIFKHLRHEFTEFLTKEGSQQKSECYIPMTVGNLVNAGHAQCKVLRSNSPWFGVTYREDKPRVVESVQALIAKGEYPAKLWT